jgi:glycosyltransferase involved in cell wall biosynthesis
LCHKADLLVANDLDTLLPNYIISRFKRIPIVYDSHEYFTGVPEIQKRPFVKWVWKEIEKSILPHLKYIITVSDSIAGLYEEEYGISPIIIRNCSRKSDKIIPFSREELDVPENKLLLVFQGTGINVDRGGEELIDAMKLIDNAFLIVIGAGDVFHILRKKAEEADLTASIKFIGKMSWDELMRYTKAADLGLSLDKDTNLNYKYSLPNKLFDYISAGTPVVAGDLPEVTKIITANSIGVTIQEVTAEAIAKAVNILNENRDLLKFLRNNAAEASVFLNWDEESKKVVDLYRIVLNIK